MSLLDRLEVSRDYWMDTFEAPTAASQERYWKLRAAGVERSEIKEKGPVRCAEEHAEELSRWRVVDGGLVRDEGPS